MGVDRGVLTEGVGEESNNSQPGREAYINYAC